MSHSAPIGAEAVGLGQRYGTESQAVGLHRWSHCGGQLGRSSRDPEWPDAAGCRSQAAQRPGAYQPPSTLTELRAPHDHRGQAIGVDLEALPSMAKLCAKRSCAWRPRSRPYGRFPVSARGLGPRRTTAHKNGCDPNCRGSPYPCGHYKDDSIRALGGPEGWPCESIFPRTTCRCATA